jgi:DnaK suppressor protein
MKRNDVISKMWPILIRRREALRRSLGQELMVLSQHELGDEGDVAQETCDGEVSSKLVQSETRELAQIERAIARLKEGRYGICEECEGRISRDRLLAVPYATLCIKCQRATEKAPVFPPRGAAVTSSESRRMDGFGGNSPRVPLRKQKSVIV